MNFINLVKGENNEIRRSKTVNRISSESKNVEKYNEKKQILRLFKIKALKNSLFETHLNTFISNKQRIRNIDIIILTFDILTITTFYFENFNYINNDFRLSLSSNIIRSILLFTSIILCIYCLN